MKNTDIPICEVANPGGSPCTKPKGHDEGHDLAAYGSLTNIPILDDDATNLIEARSKTGHYPSLETVAALCQAVRALRAENERAINVLVTVTAHNDTVAALQSQLEQVTKERDSLQDRLGNVEITEISRFNYRRKVLALCQRKASESGLRDQVRKVLKDLISELEGLK